MVASRMIWVSRRVRPGFEACLEHAVTEWSRHDYMIDLPATPMLPDANLSYQLKEALDGRKWAKGGHSFLFCSRSF